MTNGAVPVGVSDSPVPAAEARRLLKEKKRTKDAKGSLIVPYYSETMGFAEEGGYRAGGEDRNGSGGVQRCGRFKCRFFRTHEWRNRRVRRRHQQFVPRFRRRSMALLRRNRRRSDAEAWG